MARVPIFVQGCKLASRPRFRCFRKAVVYCRDSLVNLVSIVYTESVDNDPA